MHHRRLLIASIGFVVVVAGGLPMTLPATANEAASKPRVFVEVADTATLAPDGRSVTIDVTASCHRRWQVLEAFITVSQPETSGTGSIPLTCTGRTQSFTVTVTSIDGAFEPGDARASAFVLVERRGRTQQAQDSEVIQLV